MNKKNKIVISMILSILIIVFSLILKNEKAFQTTSNVVSSSKIEWGIKRNNNHEQPDVGSKNKSILEQNNGICLGNSNKKKIYLTFDEGYEAGYTPKILEVLKNNDVKAAFFITAHFANTEPELVKQMIDEGHTVGNHTVNHKSMPTLSEEEIKKEVMDLHISIYQKFSYDMKYLRPPKGEFSEKSIIETNNLGYKTVMWSFAYEDWNEKNQPNKEEAKKKILNNLHNGEIMLLHGNSKTNTNILDAVIKEAKNGGYEFKSLDEFEK